MVLNAIKFRGLCERKRGGSLEEGIECVFEGILCLHEHQCRASAYVDKLGSTDLSDIGICVVVLLEEEGACIEIERDRWITVESRKCPQHTRGRQVTGTLLADQIEI